jgi:hypothetical protein
VLTHLQGEQTLFDEQIFSLDSSTFATAMFKRKADGKLAGE